MVCFCELVLELDDGLLVVLGPLGLEGSNVGLVLGAQGVDVVCQLRDFGSEAADGFLVAGDFVLQLSVLSSLNVV